MAKRKSHWLRENPGSKLPEHLLFLHTVTAEKSPAGHRGKQRRLGGGREGLETTGLPGEWVDLALLAGAACKCEYEAEQGWTGQTWLPIESLHGFWQAVSDSVGPREHLWVIAQEVGVAMRVLDTFSILPTLGWYGDRAYLGDTCTLITFRQGRRKIKFLESGNIWRADLAELARGVGIKWANVNSSEASGAELTTCCGGAVGVLMEAWRLYLDFLGASDLGSFGATLASQAMHAYRHRFMPCKIGISGDERQAGIERDAFHGARCQALRLGEFQDGPFYKLDINGAYAWAMGTFPYPSKNILRGAAHPPRVLERLLEHWLVVAQVVLETDIPAYSLKIGRRLLYPVGTFQTTLTTPELMHALLHNAVKAVGRVQLYEPADLFSEYVDFFTAKRLEFRRRGMHLWEGLAKKFRNALFGKFGQRGYSQKVIGEIPVDRVFATEALDGDTGDILWKIGFGGKVILERQTGESQDSFPAVAAHVTAYLRMRLFELMIRAGRGNVYYVDTDALIVNQAGYERLSDLVDPNEPGKLKIEGKGDTLTIWAAKWYDIGGHLTTAGVKDGAVRVGKTRFLQPETQSLRGALRAGDGRVVRSGWVSKRFRGSVAESLTSNDGHVVTPRLSMRVEDLRDLVGDPRGPAPRTWWVDQNWLSEYARRPLGTEGDVELHIVSGQVDPFGPDGRPRWPVPPVVCQVDGQEYRDLDEAFGAAAAVRSEIGGSEGDDIAENFRYIFGK